MNDVKRLVDSRDRLGEGPVWDTEAGLLYWTDIEGQRVHRCAPDGNRHETFDLGVKVGAIGLRTGGGLVLATARGFATYEPGGDLSILENPLPPGDGVRFNDGITDPLGRFWAGSMGAKDDALYILEGRAATRFAGGFGLPNGMGFSPDANTLYFTDSDAKTIYAYPFDPETGAMGKQRVFVATQDEGGVPDGLTVDADGYVWSARWGGWKLSRYDPEGRLERDIPIPAEQVTSCAFGGENLDTLFVTTAREGLSEEQLGEQPQAGSLFVVEAGVTGKLEYRFKPQA